MTLKWCSAVGHVTRLLMSRSHATRSLVLAGQGATLPKEIGASDVL
jgi:hypothetical protein